ncbi:MAG TPA: HAMP domain-containing sensor histidine kinase [Chloroflexota bacterium]|jgi:signal transduction histidine kinase|nr:HAMP domain-containing sensor histidine kinase [Chloroflexota bacterium]
MTGWQPFVREYGYAIAIGLVTLVALVALPDARPSSDAIYAPLSLATLAGLLLTVRLAPDRPAGALVLVPAMALDARFGLAGLPAIAYAAILVNLIRGLRGPRVISGAGHTVLAFTVAHLCAQVIPVVPDWVVFAIVFATVRLTLWHLAARLDGSAPEPREEKPEVLLSLPLAPIGLLPLAAGERLGDGALLLASAALLALLFVVRESANLATARTEMESQRDKLASANALQDEMIHLITHELRNPLTLVMSYSQMSQRAAQDENYTSLPTYLSNIERAGRTIQRLMENLLQLSKLERSDELPTAEPVQVNNIISQVIGDLAPLARQKQQALTAGSADVEPALAVPMLLRDALSNLVSNAVKYTPEGGDIAVWAERGRRAHTVEIFVRDTGIGLSSEDQARLFTKFFRSSDPRVQRERGTGLGLALTHALVTRSGGTIEVDSEPDRGTTFRLTLPSVAPA